MALVKRGDKWGVKVWANGRHHWLGTFPKQADAKRAERDFLDRPTAHAGMTVEQWATVWLAEYARQAPATQRTYRYAAGQITRDIGSLRLADVDRPTAKSWANRWPRGTSRVARTMFADALRDGLCPHNPFTSLRLETPKGRRDITALTEGEIDRLAEIARQTHGDYGDEAAAIVLFAGFTGVRPGELAALQWSDLNPAEREATICRALDGRGDVKAPKNGLARIIVLPPRALEALGMVARRTDSPYVFHTVRGRRLSKGTLAYVWRPVAAAWRQAGGREITPYHLRHACATLLLERGLTPSDVAEQLGHTDGGRLVQTCYGHPDQERARERTKMVFAAGPGGIIGVQSNRPGDARTSRGMAQKG